MQFTNKYLNENGRRSLLDVVTGGKEVPIKIEVVKETQQALYITAGILAAGAIISTLIYKYK